MVRINEHAGEYTNIHTEGNLRVSISEELNEVLVYEDGLDEPVGRYSLTTGKPLDRNL